MTGSGGAEGRVYHLELRQFPHNVCRFNISEAELREQVLVPWAQEKWIEFGERKWSPHQATLTVLRGPRIPFGQLTMGRGWRTAQRDGEEVTEELLARVRGELAGGGGEVPGGAQGPAAVAPVAPADVPVAPGSGAGTAGTGVAQAAAGGRRVEEPRGGLARPGAAGTARARAHAAAPRLGARGGAQPGSGGERDARTSRRRGRVAAARAARRARTGQIRLQGGCAAHGGRRGHAAGTRYGELGMRGRGRRGGAAAGLIGTRAAASGRPSALIGPMRRVGAPLDLLGPGGRSSAGRAPGCGPGGRGFESPRSPL